MMAEKPNFISICYKWKLHHFLFWAMLFIFWFSRYRDLNSSGLETFIRAFVFLAIVAIAVYTTIYWFIPNYLNQKKVLLFIVCTGGIIVLQTAMLAIGLKLLDKFYFHKVSFSITDNFYLWVVTITLYVGLAIAIKLLIAKYKEQNYLELLEKNRLEMEIKYLKAQMEPHFLLNSLNTIYYKIDKGNTEAREILIRFADMLKYQLYNSNMEKVDIETEIEYLKNYVDMQQVRLNKNYKVEFTCDENLKGIDIVPHLLLAFFENAFKHVSHFEDKVNEIKISVCKQADYLILYTMNTKEERHHDDDPKGIGLTNVRRRLNLLYPERHELLISETESGYEVNLKLKI